MMPNGQQNRLVPPPKGGNSNDYINCVVCTKLGRILDCCKALRGPCLTCAEFHQLLNKEVDQQVSDQLELQIEQNDTAWRTRCDDLETQIKTLRDTPQKRAQEKSDYIESLKRQAEEADAEDKRLKNILEERKETLKSLRMELSARERPLEFTVKEVKKGKKGKKGMRK